MIRSRETCSIGGVYAGDCPCGREIAARAGERLPACTACRREVRWRLLYRVAWSDRDVQRPAAARRPA
jgi:hypothetical protein